ncbi:hypothetical protein cypCar_00004400 [Cyprinus carpio]|nr:hypothetical protein cypCar_00004400 [Cyprinus carpio]
MDDQGQSDEEEKGSPLNAGIEVMVLQHVNEAEMEKEKNKETEEEAGHSQSKTYRWNPARKVCNISSSSAFKLSKPRWRLDCKLGYFDLIGCDFLIEEDFKVRHKKMVWLLKMNCYPALHANCEVLKDVIHLLKKHQPRPHQSKPLHSLVELQLSKCTWQHPAAISNLNVPPQPVRSAIGSLSAPALSKGSNSTQRLGAQGRQTDKMEHMSCNLKTSKIHLAEPYSFHTVATEMKENKEKEQEDDG